MGAPIYCNALPVPSETRCVMGPNGSTGPPILTDLSGVLVGWHLLHCDIACL